MAPLVNPNSLMKSNKNELQRLRSGLNNNTNAYRLIHGDADGWKRLYVDRLADYLLIQSTQSITQKQKEAVQLWQRKLNSKAIYFKRLNRQIQKSTKKSATAKLLYGNKAPQTFEATELMLRYQLSLNEGYSTGLFLDMRDNRQRILNKLIEPDFPLFERFSGAPKVLNTFSYTCSLSVCAAKTGAITTNIDLSKKYLDWGQKNFQLNNINSNEHNFIYGDTLEWMNRLTKKKELYDLVILDPPTFSRSKISGIFQAKQHYSLLVKTASNLVRKNGIILACTNASTLTSTNFNYDLRKGIHQGGRKIIQIFHAVQPIDFPSNQKEPAHLKASWLKLN